MTVVPPVLGSEHHDLPLDAEPIMPLMFRPILREYVWGGRRLGDLLGKSLGPGPHYAESWELVDRPEAQSVVCDGPWAGWTLSQLWRDERLRLAGQTSEMPERFPLLFKFLDAQRALSVQVHPNDQQAARRQPPDLGKTEAWVILAAEPGSRLYAGLKAGVDHAAVTRAMQTGQIVECLHELAPAVGDCIFVPAGTVHALGAGLLVAEIQQASDTTFRLYDWGRVDSQGVARTLHVQEALEVMTPGQGPVTVQTPHPTDRPHVERLVGCDYFLLDRWRVSRTEELPADGRLHFWAIVEGQIRLAGPQYQQILPCGATVLLPASRTALRCHPDPSAVVLDIQLP